MKKILSPLAIAAALALTAVSIPETTTNDRTNLNHACRIDQCHATAKSTGMRCKHCVSKPGDLYCWQHR